MSQKKLAGISVEERRNCVAVLDFSVDLHRYKPLISLVLFTLHFHCFQGWGIVM